LALLCTCTLSFCYTELGQSNVHLTVVYDLTLNSVENKITKNFLCADLLHVKGRDVEALSGGELQRFACAMVCIQRADM